MSSASRPFILAVVILVAVFALCLASTLLSTSGGGHLLDAYLFSPDAGGRMDALRSKYFGSATVVASDIVGCVPGATPTTCTCARECDLRIPAANAGSRDLQVVAEQAMHLHFAMNGEANVPMDADLATNEAAKFPVMKEGAVLTLTCSSGAACALRVEGAALNVATGGTR